MIFYSVICVVAKVIDIGNSRESSGLRTIDVSGEDYGYIVSHQNYERYDYWDNRNWTLTLTGLKSTRVEIEFEYLDLRGLNGECDDYLQISSSSKICESSTGKITVDLPSAKSVSFNFITSDRYDDDGFWLQYKGRLKL